MKKTVKSLIIAASVAAIAGIGAVSFAAWQDGTTSTNFTGATGKVDTIGAINVTSDLASNVLIPFDQSATGTGQAKLWKLTITSTSTGDTAVSYKIALGTLEGDDVDPLDNGKLYLFTGTGDVEYADPTTTTAATNAPNGWEAITTAGISPKLVNTNEAYIILVSDNTGDMEKDFKIVVSASQE